MGIDVSIFHDARAPNLMNGEIVCFSFLHSNCCFVYSLRSECVFDCLFSALPFVLSLYFQMEQMVVAHSFTETLIHKHAHTHTQSESLAISIYAPNLSYSCLFFNANYARALFLLCFDAKCDDAMMWWSTIDCVCIQWLLSFPCSLCSSSFAAISGFFFLCSVDVYFFSIFFLLLLFLVASDILNRMCEEYTLFSHLIDFQSLSIEWMNKNE